MSGLYKEKMYKIQQTRTSYFCKSCSNDVVTFQLNLWIVLNSVRRGVKYLVNCSNPPIKNSLVFITNLSTKNSSPFTTNPPMKIIFTARKRSLGQGNILSSMCQGFCPQGVPGPRGNRDAWSWGCLVPGGGCLVWGEMPGPGGGCLVQGGAWSCRGAWSYGGAWSHGEGTSSWGIWSWRRPGPQPRGKLRGIWSRPTPKGEVEGNLVQAHTQGESWGESGPGPHPRGKLRGIWSRPTSKGEVEGELARAHPWWLLLWAVHIILECILVVFATSSIIHPSMKKLILRFKHIVTVYISLQLDDCILSSFSVIL